MMKARKIYQNFKNSLGTYGWMRRHLSKKTCRGRFKPGLIGKGKLDPVTGEFSLDLLRPSKEGENLIVKEPPEEGSVVVLEADHSTGVVKVLRR